MNIHQRDLYFDTPYQASAGARGYLDIKEGDIVALYAKGTNGAFGKDGGLCWNNPIDMEFFRQLTFNGVVVMGRNTFDSLPCKHRPLSNRINIVVTTKDKEVDLDYIVCESVDDALEQAARYNLPIFVIGGAQIFKEALPKCHYAVVTDIPYEGEFDVAAPAELDTYFEKSYTIHNREGNWNGTTIGLYSPITV